MAADEPPYLTIGTDVSAKYKGAFCEAKVKKVNRVVKCKVTFKNNLGTFMVTDDQIKGPLRIGADIDAKHPEKSQFCEAVINKLQDYSQYTVVFDDGDETTLRRTSLCLKSGRHFAESPTLDQFPLTNPEHFGTPVIGTSKFKRKRRSTMNSSIDYESSEDESVPRRVKAIRGKEQNPDLGKVVCVDYGDRRKKENWYPGLIYPHPAQSSIKIAKEEHLVRSFKDGKYYQVPKRDIREFTKESIQKVENNSLKTAIEKATNYLEKDELPPNWDKALFASLDALSGEEDSQETDSDTSDDEPSEEKDRFVAQLYKFMDERGTPINKAPTVSNRDLNLYKLFKIMHKLGGYNKVTNKNKWKVVYVKMGLPQSNVSGPNQIKFAYKRFLQSFEDFYRKLGCTMVSNSRSTRGRHRSDRNIIITRTRDRETASPKSRSSKESKEKVPTEKKVEEKPKPAERKDIKPEDNSPKIEDKTKTPDKKQRAEKQQQPPRSEDERRRTPKTPEDKPRLARQASLTKDKKDTRPPEKARTREDARKEKVESPEKKGTRSSLKMEQAALLKDSKDKKEEKAPLKKEDKITPVKDKIVKKEDKSSSRERKPPPREKRQEEKVTPKREIPSRDKKEDKVESPKEDKPSPKPKKEEVEEKSPKRKLGKDKPPRNQSEEKVKAPEEKVKILEEPEVKVIKEDKSSLRGDSVTRKDEPKEKLKQKEELVLEASGDERDASSHDSFERKPPGPRLRAEEGEDPPSKAKRRSLKPDEKDEKESLLGMSDSDESGTNDSEKNYKEVKHNEIEIGDRVKVKYGRGRLQKVYEAKVLKIEMDGTEKRFYVHYAGWNTRYDEWVRKNYIVANISSTKQQKPEGCLLKPSSSSSSLKKVDRGRPPGILANTKPDRKNSTSSGSSSRATRSERKVPLSVGLEATRRTRRKSGTATSATDASQESDTDAMDPEEDEDMSSSFKEDMSSSFKEELFSDDEEKEKFEDAKRGDITELEKAIGEEDFHSEEKKVVNSEDEVKAEEKKNSPDVNGKLAIEDEKSESLISKKEDAKSSKTVPEDKKSELVGSGSPPSVTDCSISLGRLPSQASPVPESKAALSFEGLIKKSIDSIDSLKKPSVTKEALPREKGAAPGSVSNKSEHKKEAAAGDSTHSVSIFGSVLSSFQNSNITSGERKSSPKDVCSSFSSIIKPVVEVGGLKKQSQVEFKNRTILHNPSQDLKIPSESTTPFNLTPGSKKISEPITCSLASTTKLSDTKSAKLEDPKISVRSLDIKVPVRLVDSTKVEDVKYSARLVDAKCTDRLGDSKGAIRFGDTKNPGMRDTKSPARLGDTKISARLGDTKSPARLSDTRSPARLGDTKNLTSLSDSKGCDIKGSVKLGDNKISARLEDINNPAKVIETKSLIKLGDSKTPVRVTDLASGTKMSEVKNATKLSDVKSSAKSTVVMPPAKLSDMSLAKLRDSPAKQFINSPVKFSETNSPFKVNSCNTPAKLIDAHPSPVISPYAFSKSSDITSSVKSSDSNTSLKLSDSGNTSKASDVKKDAENKPKDSFDLLLQSSSNTNYSHNPSKISDVKDVFSFSFGSHSTSKESSMGDTSFSKYPSETICRITPKSSETVDVSKMIPGILERLKKDVVSDSKASDSPPPPKEELSFDFLRGSHTSSKSLSRSDSSNSLRICESDTNDSNTELKDTKLENPPDAMRLPEAKTVVKTVPKPSSESNLSSSSSSNAYSNVQKVNATVTSQQASVITATTSSVSRESQPVSDKGDSLASKEEPKVPISADPNVAVTEDTALKPEDIPKPDTKKSLFSKASSPLDRFSVFGSAVEKDSSASSGTNPLPIKCESKESLFDEIKASFDELNPVSKYEQSSVIKFISDTSEAGRPENCPTAETVDKKDCKSVKEQDTMESKVTSDDQDLSAQDSSLGVMKDSTTSSSAVPEKELSADASAPHEGSLFSQLSKKDVKRKKLGKKSGKKLGFSELSEKEGKDRDSKLKEGKIKSKKRLRHEHLEGDKTKGLDLKAKSKKIKKNKKRFSRHDESFSEHLKKFEFRDEDHTTPGIEKMKKRDRKRSEKKFLKSGAKSEDFQEGKKKKSKKNRDKMAGDKKDFFEKKTKKKRKPQPEDNQDTDSEKESLSSKKRKKERKKFKVKDCSSSDEADFFKDKSSYLRQDSSKSDDPDMSFLLCEEKVPASPGGDLSNDSSGTSSNDELEMDLLPGPYPSCSRDSPNKHSVLDNTPPTTPSSTESLLSSSPSHHDVHYPESTQSCEGEAAAELFHAGGGRTVARASEEYRAAATLAFAVCKSVADKPGIGGYSTSVAGSSSKRDRGDHSPSKRKKKRVQRYSEAAKSPKHKSTFPRMSKVDNYCEDSSGTSPATSSSPPYGNLSSLSFSRSLPHRLSSVSEGSSRYFYVPLHEKDPEKRITVLQDKMAALRKKYMALRAEVIAIDHKRRKARKKVRESGGTTTNPSVHSEDGHSCS